MGDSEHARGGGDDEGGFPESVTGVGGPVLLAATVPELGRGDVLAGRYQIEAVIGSGGSGRVMRAFDRVTRELVALKILRPEFAADPVWTERFSRELRVGRQIQHPNVCRVFDIGEADGHRFLSMELATGGTIRSQVDPTTPPRPLDERIADARAVIDGVAALHAAGIVHRDLKPENILRMGDRRLVVTDFGLATDPGAGPATTIMIGTPRYMAPEVVMGDPATARADVWALGIVLHEILFGCRPDRSVVKRGYRRFTAPKATSAIERRLAELCGRCSDDAPAVRPASSLEVVFEFRAALAGHRLPRKMSKQIAWGIVAIAAIAVLGLVRNRWTNSASASSSRDVGGLSSKVLQPKGTPEDWSTGSTKLTAFAGAVHCYSSLDGGRKIRVIWGTPRKAHDIDLKSGRRALTDLHPDTYADGCPQVSPNGTSVLFTRTNKTGSHVFLSPSPDGRSAIDMGRGSWPEWLANGQEYAFELDFRHAAIFSINTGQITVLGEGLAEARQLAEKTVDPTGRFVAARYFTDTVNSLVVVQALPSLTVVGRMLLPQSAGGLRFTKTGDRILFSLNGLRGDAELVSSDWRMPSLSLVGAFPGRDLKGILELGGGTNVVVSRRLRRDLFISDPDSAVQITQDGKSSEGSLSVNGDLVVQRGLPNGRFVIVLRRMDGTEKQVTNGPTDMTPTFFPDGTRWLHADYSSRGILECRVADLKCKSLLTDPLTPVWPSIDPLGHRVAYMTFMNTPRLHVLDLDTGARRDLGTVSAECAPVWASDGRVWVGQTSEERISWSEIDSHTGQRTGKISSVANLPGRTCLVPHEVVGGTLANRSRLSSRTDEATELTLRDTSGSIAAAMIVAPP